MNSPIQLDGLTVLQRLDLIAQIWDSIPESSELDVPKWHDEELERRLAAADSNPSAGVPWEEALARLKEKR